MYDDVEEVADLREVDEVRLEVEKVVGSGVGVRIWLSPNADEGADGNDESPLETTGTDSDEEEGDRINEIDGLKGRELDDICRFVIANVLEYLADDE